MRTLPAPAVHIAASPGKGRGVFALRQIRSGEIVEIAPVIVIEQALAPHIEQTVLNDYVFDWADGGLGVVLGYGMVYNHSYTPNARYIKRFDTQEVEYVALVDIDAGEEVRINYNGIPDDRTPLWFEVDE